MKQFTVHAAYDRDAQVWWGSNDQLPLTTEAETFEALMRRVGEIAPEIAVMNGLVDKGERVRIHFTADADIVTPAE